MTDLLSVLSLTGKNEVYRDRVLLAIMAKGLPGNEPAKDVLEAIRSTEPYASRTLLVVDPGDPLSSYPFPSNVSVHKVPWIWYGPTRNAMLSLCDGREAEWILMLDSDDRMVSGGQLPDLDEAERKEIDAFHLDVLLHGSVFRRPHLIRARRGWHFRCRVHEALYGPDGHTRTAIRWPYLRYLSAPGNGTKETFLEHARLLADDLREDPKNSRAAYYLAQSLANGGEECLALAAYVRRARMGNGDNWEEVYHSWLRAGHLAAKLEYPSAAVQAFYLEAAALWPNRAETWIFLAEHHRHRGEGAQSLTMRDRAMRCPWPADAVLEVQPSSYNPAVVPPELRQKVAS